MKFVSRLFASFIAGPLCCCSAVTATETENFGIAVLPTPGSVIVDGKTDDWDLTGGLFACGDVENLRDTMSLWYHAMYDADNLYLLARWNDATPLNNPGVTSGDLGFRGDCLQTRVITEFDKPDERVTHLTCWRGKDGRDVVKLDLGRRVNEGEIADLKSLGAKQAFLVATDGRHYAQEIAIPWAQLAVNKKSPGPGGEVRLAIEANFTVGSDGRMTIKDCFQPGVALDRVFTFRAVTQWGSAKLERAGNVSPRKVRLSDGREFAVHLEKGQPVVDWTGLQQASEVASLKTIPFDMPEDGYASVVLRAEGGSVVRHLLNSQRLAKGRHELKWDGLATYNWKQPGDPVPAGTYQATALVHKELDLRLVGWADNSGTTPWDFPATSGNWGGDHGNPTAAAADKDKVYLGWTGAEAGKAVVACDLTGKPVWHHTRGGIGSGSAIATDGGIVFVVDRITKPVLYRLDSRTGQYSGWQGRDTAELELDKVFENLTDPKADRFSLAGGGGRLYLASQSLGQIAVLDAATGAVQERLTIPSPQSLALSSDGKLYVLTAGTVVVRDGNQFKPVLRDLTAPASIAVDGRGQIYVGVGEPDNQVKVYAADGKIVRTIGRAGGRALLGPWTPEGMRFVDGIVLDAQGKVWVMENDAAPRRVSAWNADGTLAHEFFGGTSYGAPGGSICPSDPFVMAGQGCEWRIDPKTGLARCTAVVLREGMELSRFVSSPEGRVYLYVYSNAGASSAPTRIFERLGDGQYKLRSVLFYADEGGNELPPSPRGKMAGAKQTMLWADANDDGQRQKDEITGGEGEMRFSGWFMYVTPDGALYSGDKQFKLKGLTACGAPLYDLAHPTIMPAPGLGSTDGRLVFTWNREGIERGWNQVFEIATGKQRFQYPDTFVGVHGSHKAPPPIDGLIRGAFPPCGTAKLPEPIGNIWVIPTNVGEWLVLSEHGYYLA
ncbi:MAG TPA: hypothetical protein VMF30_12040, partial [Pirellulales bacterium]|nr:hypothetical protein [Pirellulales bacterium]